MVGSLTGVGALQQIDSGCGQTGKLVADAVAVSDPDIDFSDFDTDKDGVVDFFMVVYAGCGGNGASQLGACSDASSDLLPYDNIWPHSSSLEGSIVDPVSGLTGFTTDDQLKDLTGKPHEEAATGFFAACMQHEIDQLDGVFWLQRLSRLKRDRVIKKWEKSMIRS